MSAFSKHEMANVDKTHHFSMQGLLIWLTVVLVVYPECWKILKMISTRIGATSLKGDSFYEALMRYFS